MKKKSLIDVALELGIPDSRLRRWIRSVRLRASKEEGKIFLDPESLPVLRLMKKFYDSGKSPRRAFELAARELNIDIDKDRSDKRVQLGMQFVGALANEEPVSIYEAKLPKKLPKSTFKTRLGINGFNVKYRDHVAIMISSGFRDYGKVFAGIAKAGEESGDYVWFLLADDRGGRLSPEFDPGKTRLFDWSQLEAAFRDDRRFSVDKLMRFLGPVLDQVKGGGKKFRFVFEITSRLLDYVDNYEDFLAYEKNVERAVAAIPINILFVCTYREEDFVSFRKKMESMELLKNVVFSHDKIFYLGKENRIFEGTEACFKLFDEDFAGLSNHKDVLSPLNA